MSPSSDSKSRVIIAWLTLYVMVIGGAILTYCCFACAAWYYLGGLDLIINILNGVEDKAQGSTSVLLPLIFVSVPLGAKSGVWLWGKLARKCKLISDSRIRKMLGQ
jgi:H+/Cl- antiporter ClcA